ncbi:hypothetical protein DSM106972_019890 [Dulcicalothrix desertica PCC 7102]|uniref:ABC transporter domain-containing protein n=1 Tax=Dulcicalothrix desertica PCC 7102 TaxID=232991 RepID=A0A3S1CSH4_9CYAN|nr:ABC transporter ATP-binding protein [Dulcicalothrix desertica]RUT07729.1 hypothetical protein DSM106972_019890 [Dulcicalothrix desertica PCC 7102]
MDLLDTPITIHTGDTRISPEKVRGEVELNNITFAYKNRFPIIKNVSLVV